MGSQHKQPTKICTVRLPEDVHARHQVEATALGLSLSAYLARIIGSQKLPYEGVKIRRLLQIASQLEASGTPDPGILADIREAVSSFLPEAPP